jgi:hypothetical protein
MHAVLFNMKIYFTCSTAEFVEHKDKYFAIRDFIVEENHVLTMDWLVNAQNKIDKGVIEIPDIKEIYKECINGINEADLVIIEDTVSNFSTGHQITVALQKQKPTLVLWNKPKHRHFNQTFIQGIDSDILEVKEYSMDNYKEIIHTFIKKYENASARNRFHLVLNDVERKYLDWAQFTKNKSRTKVIRDSLKEVIEGDEDYKKYLGRN